MCFLPDGLRFYNKVKENVGNWRSGGAFPGMPMEKPGNINKKILRWEANICPINQKTHKNGNDCVP